jgi:hypothetical protein
MKEPLELSHFAVFVERLESSTLSPALGQWGEIRELPATPVAVGERSETMSGRARTMRTDHDLPFAVSVEEAAAGAPIGPAAGNAWHHLAFWSRDLSSDVAALEADGYRVDVSGLDGNGALTLFAYLVSATGPRIELLDARRRDGFYERAGALTGAPSAAGISGGPLRPRNVAAVVDDVEGLMERWRIALGLTWNPLREARLPLITPDGPQELTVGSTTADTVPKVTLFQPLAGTALQPAPDNAWHHVAFWSVDLPGDVARLEQHGYVLELAIRGEAGEPSRFAILRSPEGTRVGLHT